MAVESFYFSHDYNARNDRKLMKLQMSMGMNGIGIYWCIIEMLYEEGGYLIKSECERIAFELRTNNESIDRVINEFDLFKNDGLKFWSDSVLRRLEIRDSKSNKARESALIRWNRKNDANALRTDSESNAIKERKGKEKKGNEKKEEPLALLMPFDSDNFINIWNHWKEYKKIEFKFQYKSVQSQQSALSELNKMANGQEHIAIAIIQQSMANGWKGFVTLKAHQQNGKQQQGFSEAAARERFDKYK